MIKSKNGFKLSILSAIVLLIIVLLAFSSTNAWFTYGDGQKIECIVSIGEFGLKLYQIDSADNETQIYPTNASSPSYVDLRMDNSAGAFEILPDKAYNLKLQLTNADAGSEAYYLRYRISMLVCNQNKNDVTELNLALTGMNTGFASGGDGYYYYGTGSTQGALMPFDKGKSTLLCTNFSIPYSEFYTKGFNGDIVKLKIVVECTADTF